ncbi:uncharacterized protein LOC111702789 [Eurytemora carolleeae]|uniref:uncharacterized protein LOC111702789 n=1 Tax=Eurytemora carolleeae TaxID=1294199 RepID=UPI000C77B415|nr:uncharacterized protein LOC111702789 [Eurytemora carolleeae]|eukprot:XP_023330330.1 uncharacterized protein LOC111702789 [Eurytemora affinis]
MRMSIMKHILGAPSFPLILAVCFLVVINESQADMIKDLFPLSLSTLPSDDKELIMNVIKGDKKNAVTMIRLMQNLENLMQSSSLKYMREIMHDKPRPVNRGLTGLYKHLRI